MRATLLPLEPPSIIGESATTSDPVLGWALIDTGATVTCIDQKAAQKAGLRIVGTGPVASATHSNEVVPIFAAQLIFEGLKSWDATIAYGTNLESLGLIALVGRDVLAGCMFVYNGPDGSFSLAT